MASWKPDSRTVSVEEVMLIQLLFKGFQTCRTKCDLGGRIHVRTTIVKTLFVHLRIAARSLLQIHHGTLFEMTMQK